MSNTPRKAQAENASPISTALHTWLIVPLWYSLHLLIPLDKPRLDAVELIAGLIILLGVIRAWTELGRARRREGMIALVSLAVASALGFFLVTQRDIQMPSTGKMVGSFFLVAAALILIARLGAGPGAGISAERGRIFWLRGALLFLALAYASCFFALSPERSFHDFPDELGLYIPLALCLILWAERAGSLRPALRPLVIAATITCAVSICVFLFAAMGGGSMREAFESREWIRWDGVGPIEDRPWRLQFPFTHHNRLGSYGAVAVFAILALFRGKGAKPWGMALALLPALVVALSMTRGAYLALGMGAIAFVAAERGKARQWIIGAAVAGLFIALALPGPRRQFASLFDPDTYTDPGSTVYLRYYGLRAGAIMAAERPILGIGFGPESYERQYRNRFKDEQGDPELKPHAHNNFIEIAAETGVPAMLVFLGLNIALGIGLWRRRGETSEISFAGLFALLIAINGFGLANYSLRHGMGFVIWMLLGVMLVAVFGRSVDEAES